jgi:hypothetical protein
MNAPQAQVNIPDNALCFWFYKMATQNIEWNEWDDASFYNVGDHVTYNSVQQEKPLNWVCIQATGSQEPQENSEFWAISSSIKYESPNIFNLFCVRILPSYYKQELILELNTPRAINRTYSSYEDLATDLELATTTEDLAVANGAQNRLLLQRYEDYAPVASPDEITITYNKTNNKFVFEGQETFTRPIIDLWDANTYYPPQSLVRYTPEGQEEQIFYNRTAEITYPPDNASPLTSWNLYEYDQNTVWNTYLVAGYNDPNVIYLQGDRVDLEWNADHLFLSGSKSIFYKGNYWDATLLSQNVPPPADGMYNSLTYYQAGAIVYYNDSISGMYRAIVPTNGILPDNEDYWERLYYPSPWDPTEYERYTGMNYISETYDFGNRYQFLRKLGIPGQPYTINRSPQPINNQTLNRILGFTWNGASMVTPFQVIPSSFQSGSLVTLFINRLRPVPSYAYALNDALSLGVEPTFISFAYYTADSFCNLVYSSTITIYTRILGGSTTDTVRNTNLLGIMPLNCGNLGVTFSANFIDNPLFKVDNDIYSIEFEFRTDNDQPYFFSNNSVITLQLRLTYE